MELVLEVLKSPECLALAQQAVSESLQVLGRRQEEEISVEDLAPEPL